MSGICGLVDLRDEPNPTENLYRLLSQLERQGPEGTHTWICSHAALGHTLLATTPEALVEILPREDKSSGCVITADARLDNREDLALHLGLNLQQQLIGDGELILQAYLQWGEDCPKHLLGDFAFAIWDREKSRLFAARDQIGQRQLFFGRTIAGGLVFASEAKAIRSIDPKFFKTSLPRIADFLEDLEAIDQNCTFFENISRLPPAHRICFDASGLKLERYWTMEAGPELVLPSNEAYAEAFLDVFKEAVRCRLRAVGPVGSMLSGGMDSSSIVAVASQLLLEAGSEPLMTFSGVGPDPEKCDETRSVAAAAQIPDIQPFEIDYSNLGEIQRQLTTGLENLEEPFDGQMSLVRSVYSKAAMNKCKVVFDGGGADLLFLGGDAAMLLARRGEFVKLFRHAKAKRAFKGYGPGAWRVVAHCIWQLYAPSSLRRWRKGIVDTRRRVAKAPPESLVGAPLAARVGMTERRQRYQDRVPKVEGRAGLRVSLLLDPALAVGGERYDRIARSLAVEPRNPFLDLRVIAFCLSLPADQLESEGWTKVILRRAMKGSLPDEVCWRFGNSHLGGHFIQASLSEWEGWRHHDDVISRLGEGSDRICEVLARGQRRKGHLTENEVRAIFLNLWMRTL